MPLISFLQENSLFWIFMIWIFFTYSLWFIYRDNYLGKNSFDISIIGLFVILLLHRILHLIFYYENYSANFWSWNPTIWIDGSKVFFGSKPWLLLIFWQGNFDVRILLICIFLVLFVILRFQQIPFLKMINSIALVIYKIIPVILLMTYFQNILIGLELNTFWSIPFPNSQLFHHPVQVYCFLVWFLLFIFQKFLLNRYKYFYYNDSLISLGIFLLFGTFIIQFFAYNVSTFMLNWFRIIAGLLFVFASLDLIFKENKSKELSVKDPILNRFSNINLSNSKNKWTSQE